MMNDIERKVGMGALVGAIGTVAVGLLSLVVDVAIPPAMVMGVQTIIIFGLQWYVTNK